ncbi:MAG: hypothetical protein QN135_00275 [Armatimonadota bacterium]|nr:hypothetical protein [Armatimonadota bacterium]
MTDERQVAMPTNPATGHASRRFDWLVAGLGALLIGALYLDGWAHNRRIPDRPLLPGMPSPPPLAPPEIPAALTVWHAPFHAALAITCIVLAAPLLRQRDAASWQQTLGPAYSQSLIGAVLCAAATAAGALWPGTGIQTPGAAFRFESLTGMLGPAHILQAAGLLFVVTGPLRSAWVGGWSTQAGSWLPAALSISFGLSVVTFVTQFAHPLTDPWPSIGFMRTGLQTYRYNRFFFGEAMGVLSILLQATLLAATAAWILRRRRPPFGTFTIAFGLNGLLMVALQDRYPFLAVAAGAGLLTDSLAQKAAHPPRASELPLVTAAIPTVYCLLYFLVLSQLPAIDVLYGTGGGHPGAHLTGLGWSIHLSVGTTLLAAGAGWLAGTLARHGLP